MVITCLVFGMTLMSNSKSPERENTRIKMAADVGRMGV
jgi:hypothetical protein